MKIFSNLGRSRIVRNDDGVTLVEYGLAIALAIVLGASAFTLLGAEISNSMSVVGAKMPN